MSELDDLSEAMGRCGVASHVHPLEEVPGPCLSAGACLYQDEPFVALVVPPDRGRPLHVDAMTAFGALECLEPGTGPEGVWSELHSIDRG